MTLSKQGSSSRRHGCPQKRERATLSLSKKREEKMDAPIPSLFKLLAASRHFAALLPPSIWASLSPFNAPACAHGLASDVDKLCSEAESKQSPNTPSIDDGLNPKKKKKNFFRRLPLDLLL